MGKKKKQKKTGFTKHVLSHPLIDKPVPVENLQEAARTALSETLKAVLKEPVVKKTTKSLILTSVNKKVEDCGDIWSISKLERRKLLREARSALKEQSQKKLQSLKCFFTIGFKQCLKESRSGELSALLIDSSSDLAAPLEQLNCNAPFPILRVKNLSSEVIRPAVSFPGTCIGIRTAVQKSTDDDTRHIWEFLTKLSKEQVREEQPVKL